MGVGLWKAGRAPRFMAKESLFRVPVLGSILRGLGQIPVDRSGQKRALGPMKAARVLADTGSGVIVYPEGSLTRDPDLWPMRGKTGAVRMALDADIPLIPAAHWGTQILMPRYSGRIKLFPRTPITILIGKPIDLAAFRGKPIDQKLLNTATNILMNAIADLQGQLRGEKPPTKRWDPAEHNQTTTGKFK
jgi:1-acyl-sn-glycerol-3-phosphate acyltransferase